MPICGYRTEEINDPGNYYEDLLLTLGLYLVIFVIVMGNNCRALLTVQKNSSGLLFHNPRKDRLTLSENEAIKKPHILKK